MGTEMQHIGDARPSLQKKMRSMNVSGAGFERNCIGPELRNTPED